MQTAPRWKTLCAFATLYLVWGSTFLAIRVDVLVMPPLLFGTIRFLIAGSLLLGWLLVRRTPLPTRAEWRSICVISFLIFLVDYGLVFWAETRVASGLAALLVATIPAFMVLAEIVLLRTQRMSVRLAGALLVGLGGVAVLIAHGLRLGGDAIDTLGGLACIAGSLAWGVAAALSRRLPLPESKLMTAATQMLVGGVMMGILAVALGEPKRFHPAMMTNAAWVALAYVIFVGSLVGFTTYVWLIQHESPTRVGTYAYVNPVVAVVLGSVFLHETVGLRTVVGMLLILVSVVIISTLPRGGVGAVVAEEV